MQYKNSNKELSIIIVTFNSESYIYKCLESVFKSKINHTKTDIFIIDNNSSDNTTSIVKKIQEKNKNVVLVSNNNNRGFAKAVNQGIKKSIKYKYVLLLNPDTILEENSILNLVSCLEENGAGICGGKAVDFHGNIKGSYFRFPNVFVGIFDFTNIRRLTKNDRWHKYFYYQDTNFIKHCVSVDVVTGGFFLIKQSTIKKVGLFDESYFMYLEDVDYCKRAHNAGIKTFYADKSKIIHEGGASSVNKDRIRHSSWLLSRKIYFLKHFSLAQNLIVQPIFLIDDLIISVKLIFQ